MLVRPFGLLEREANNLSLMLEEIAQQPAALERTIKEERGKVARLGEHIKSRNIDLIVLVARGSSDNAALFGRYLLEIVTGIPSRSPRLQSTRSTERGSGSNARSSSASRSRARARTSIACSKTRAPPEPARSASRTSPRQR